LGLQLVGLQVVIAWWNDQIWCLK